MFLWTGSTTCTAAARLGWVAVGVAALWMGCSEDPTPPSSGPQVTVLIDPDGPRAPLHERYLGFAFDTAQFSQGKWWSIASDGRETALEPDLESEKLRRLVSELAPSLMRIGGTDCDAFYFCPDPGPCDLPPSYQDTFLEEDELRAEGVITHEDVERAANFAEAVGAEVLFCLNVGPGPRDATSGEWQPDNARELIQFATSLPNGDVFTAWEPGNEINGASFNFTLPVPITPESFAQDLLTFRALIDAEAPGAFVPAPGSYISPFGEFGDFTRLLLLELDALGEAPLDAVSWHLYATQSTTCPAVFDEASAENLFDEGLNETHRAVAQGMREYAAGLPVWNTETASAQCGGQHGVSDTLADALWYADWIGMMAAEGTSVLIRHALVGADYCLLDPDTFEPRPTFWTLVMLRRTVAHARLDTQVNRAVLKAHGFCSADGTGVTAVLVNPGDGPLVGRLELAGHRVVKADQWTVSGAAGLASLRATLNGEPVAADGTVPDPDPLRVVVIGGIAYPELPPHTLHFVQLQTDPPLACSGP